MKHSAGNDLFIFIFETEMGGYVYTLFHTYSELLRLSSKLGPISTPINYGYIIEFHGFISIGTQKE